MNPSKTLLKRSVHAILAAAACAPLVMPARTQAVELPKVCIAGTCGNIEFVGSGGASAVSIGNTLTVNQTSDRAILNWSSFNVSADGSVVFNQPSSTSIALNRIFQDSPSRIFGQVTANGEIYLINRNGIIFGKTARINAAGILASTLDIRDSVFNSGIASPNLIQSNDPSALKADGRLSVLDSDGNPVKGSIDAGGNVVIDPNGEPIKVQLTVQEGANLETNIANGRILLAGQTVDNAGSLTAKDGQVILAAGDSVYLQASDNPALRGLLVEVGVGGEVWNRVSGQISTPRGNSTLVGYAVNQEGRISATTSVAANGSVRLLARDRAEADLTQFKFQAKETGKLVLGSQSSTAVLPELSDAQTAVDAQTQYPSYVEAMGREVTFKSGSVVRANGGRLDVSAVKDPSLNKLSANDIDNGTVTHPQETEAGEHDPQSQLRIEAGAVIDLSGSDATLPMSRNLVTVELRSSELADSPNQRDSAIRGRPLVIDTRKGTPLGNIEGALAGVGRTIAERTSVGGTAVFVSDGDIVATAGSRIDISGGIVNYEAGTLQTTQLIGADGKIYDVGSADPNRTYVGLINPVYRRIDDKWGQVSTTPLQNLGSYEAGYVEGKSAGTLQFIAPTMILNGTFRGETVSGPYQRSAATQPAGGTLLLGLTEAIKAPGGTQDFYGAPNVNFVRTPPTTVVAAGASLATLQTLSLPVDYLSNGFNRTRVFSNGSIALGDNMPLELVPGSIFELSANRIAIHSDIRSLGGQIGLTARDTFQGVGVAAVPSSLVIDSGVTLDVRGQWINDSLTPMGVRPLESTYYQGGSIAMTLMGSAAPAALRFGDDVALLADGGAHMTQTGSVLAGSGGVIRLQTNALSSTFVPEIEFGKGLGLSAFGALGADGGAFQLNLPAVRFVQDDTWLHPQRYDVDADFIELGSGLFSNHGFSTISISAFQPRETGVAARDIIQILGDVELKALVYSRLLNADIAGRASGGTIDAFSTAVLPEVFRRRSASVNFNGTSFGTSSANAGSVTVQEGARLSTGIGGAFTFASRGSVVIDGSISAPSGRIDVKVNSPAADNDAGFIEGQRIEIGEHASLSTAGTVVYTPNDLQLRRGTVSAGGSISLTADRGSVAIAKGSTLDISGAAAPIDILIDGEDPSVYSTQVVTSDAGSLSVSAREGIDLSGDVRAFAGTGGEGSSAGGSLTVQLVRGVPDQSTADSFPDTERTLRLVRGDGDSSGRAEGIVDVSTDFVSRSGFDSVALRVFDEVKPATASIQIEDGVNLSVERRIALDASKIEMVNGGVATLSASYVSIGNSSDLDSRAASDAGNGQLQVQAGFIDLVGSSVLSGIRLATFSSDQDIRLRGTSRGDGRIAGGLTLAGDLRFGAARMYGSTLSDFVFKAQGGPTDRIQILQRGSLSGTPLSVGSRLSFIARSIEQGGTLLAPFGSISFNGSDSVSLLDGSVTSVSGSNQLFPYGFVSNGAWSYNTGRTTLAFESLAAPNVSIESGIVFQGSKAIVDLSGGGDLYAYEWVPGTGGTRDALSNPIAQASGTYAVLPSLAGQFASFDAQFYFESTLQMGDSVYLSGLGGLAAGVYPLLPARYALLPGAYLINIVPSVLDIEPGSVLPLTDGTPVIAGYRTFGTSGVGGNRFTGYAIRPGDFGRALAQYDDFRAGEFLTARALRLELDRTRSPFDAGVLSLFAGTRLDLQGTVKTAPANGGRGAAIEVSAPNLAITASGADDDAATVDIGADKLSSWNPSSVLLGVQRDAAGDLNVGASTVTVRDDAKLVLDEVLIAAHDEVSLEGRSAVSSRSGANTAIVPMSSETEFTLRFAAGDSNAAVLAVSDLRAMQVDRTGAAPIDAGEFNMSATSTVASRGALLIDAPAGADLAGTLVADGARASIGSQSLEFGVAAKAGALVIDQRTQNQLQGAASLNLSANASLAFTRETNLALSASASEVRLQAPTITGDSINVVIDAKTVAIDGAEIAAPDPQTGTAALEVNASTIELGGGSVSIAGFSTVALNASNEVIGVNTGKTMLAADLIVQSPRLGVARGVTTEIETTGDVDLRRSADNSSGSKVGLGGALLLAGDDIRSSLDIVAPSGLVSMTASGGLTLNGGVDVSGRVVTAGGRAQGSAGGAVVLASTGSITSSSSSSIALDSAGEGSAGQLNVRALGQVTLNGTLSARAANQGGSVTIDAGSVDEFAALTARLQAGGFNELQSVHVDAGDLTLAQGEQVTARTVDWTTDTGVVDIAGAIHANSSDRRGSIRLYGGAGVDIAATGVLNTDGLNGADRGGDIEIGTTAGAIDIAAASTLSAHGDRVDGTLTLRAPTVGADIAVNSIAHDVSNLDRVVLAPIIVRTAATATATTADFNNARNAATAFVTNAGTSIVDRFATSVGAPISVRPDIEIQRQGSWSIGTLDLSTWRFNGEPGALTVRATGGVTVTGTVSDGFQTTGTGAAARVTLRTGDSSTIRIAAGADVASADPTQVVDGAGVDLVLAANAIVRTGTGSLTLASSRDISFRANSTAYTGGLPGMNTALMPALTGTASVLFPDLGGTVRLTALQDVIGSPVSQSASIWQYRGTRSSPAATMPRLHGINATAFRWNVGALGGGDVVVSARRDVTNLSAAAADSEFLALDDTLSAFGGGSLSVEAGRDISSGNFFGTKGALDLRSSGEFGSSRINSDGADVGTLLWLADTRASIESRGDVFIETIVNPTTILNSVAAAGARASAYFTYSDDSSARIASASGTISLMNTEDRLKGIVDASIANASNVLFSIYPSTLIAQSFAGDIAIDRLATLYPSSYGRLELFAARDIVSSNGPSTGGIRMSDGDPNGMSTLGSPGIASPLLTEVFRGASATIHKNDAEPIRITAGRDIVGATFEVPKAIRIAADRDIADLTLVGQNVNPEDVTLITAGRDLAYDAGNSNSQINIGGPGRLDILARRDVDLGVTSGVTTTGRLLNATLPTSEGADITIMAGLGIEPDYAGFIDTVVAVAATHEQEVIDYVKQVTRKSLAFEAALAELKTLSADMQRPIVDKVFFDELVKAGREANADPKTEFKRGYAAIDSLFPGSRDTANSRYRGNLNMSFSRIYTLAGGDISLLIPGGLLNVGLANPPASIASRTADKLGIVAQREGDVRIFADQDVLVNKSRIFTLLGGDIAVWSTHGDIDAGRGAKSALSAPPPRVQITADGRVNLDFSGAVTGSGIRGIVTADNVTAGDVDLIAPAGFVNAGDAGIGSAGNLNIAAQRVIGLDNIQVGGTSTGVPAETSGLGASLSGAAAAGSSASNASGNAVASEEQAKEATPIAQNALSWLDVFVVGLGEDACKQDDIECLKRQK